MFQADKKRIQASRENVVHCIEDGLKVEITGETLNETKEDIFPGSLTEIVHEVAEQQVSIPVCQKL